MKYPSIPRIQSNLEILFKIGIAIENIFKHHFKSDSYETITIPCRLISGIAPRLDFSPRVIAEMAWRLLLLSRITCDTAKCNQASTPTVLNSSTPI